MAYDFPEAPTAANVSRELVRSLIADSYPALANDFLGPLLELLSLSRQACGGDPDKFLIMLVVARRTTEHELFATFSQEELLSGVIPVFPSLGTNINSVADSLGAPKETIRRKVADLVEAGWIVRQGHELRFTALAYRELAHVRVAIERLAARNFETVNELVRRSASAR